MYIHEGCGREGRKIKYEMFSATFFHVPTLSALYIGRGLYTCIHVYTCIVGRGSTCEEWVKVMARKFFCVMGSFLINFPNGRVFRRCSAVCVCVCVCGFGMIVGSTEPFQGAIFPAHCMYTVYSLLCPHLSKPQPPTHLHCCITPAQLCHSCAIPSTYQFTTLTHTHTHSHAILLTHTHTPIHTYTHTPIHTYTHTHIHPYTHTPIHTYTHTHIHPYTHIHTYTHTHIHPYTHIHTYTLTQTEFEVICVLCTNVGVNQEDKKPVSYTACLCTYILACFFLPSFSHLSLKHIYHVQASFNVTAPSPVALLHSLSL